eukprot:8788214-Pyramimonas_sp.AAC.1
MRRERRRMPITTTTTTTTLQCGMRRRDAFPEARRVRPPARRLPSHPPSVCQSPHSSTPRR